MRDHQSHDILLTCVMCHQRSNLFDSSMRAQLAEECGAPIGTETDVKTKENFALKQVTRISCYVVFCTLIYTIISFFFFKIKSAGRALKSSRAKIPAKRVEELEQILKEHFEVDTLTPEIIHKAEELDAT